MSATTVSANALRDGVLRLVDVIHENKQELSEIDGAIGDGDHGINMNTGFQRFRETVEGKNLDLSQMLEALGTTLLEVTGGSLGPLYGSMFLAMGETVSGCDTIDAQKFLQMLESGRDSLMEIGGAKPGDKTLLDCLCPAVDAFRTKLDEGASFEECLEALKQGAVAGKESTRDLVAKVGRASRLGERSRGVLDAGAASCCLILCCLADSAQVRSN
ncbi:MAG: dihydroxyacetone kinase subunit DhaL [Bryocella sp.]